MISVQTEIEVQGDLSSASISKELYEVNIPKEIKLQYELLAPKAKKGGKAAGKALRSEILPIIGSSIPIPSSKS